MAARRRTAVSKISTTLIQSGKKMILSNENLIAKLGLSVCLAIEYLRKQKAKYRFQI